jgi:hypothetical protein
MAGLGRQGSDRPGRLDRHQAAGGNHHHVAAVQASGPAWWCRTSTTLTKAGGRGSTPGPVARGDVSGDSVRGCFVGLAEAGGLPSQELKYQAYGRELCRYR